ncbi:MAG: SIS domain-containing protein [Opitutales bacterium]|jgi:N-acetylmuramic acid 6-phosphate etherase
MPTADTADEFLALAADYQLGALDTESLHPLTANLSHLAQDDLPAALRALQSVDIAALERLLPQAPAIAELARAVAATFAAGHRVFLCGCGATGRLSLACEWLARAGLLPPSLADRVVSFMAGGDAALIRSIENFEDFPEYGARQLDELGFAPGDLLIASTEGGETPWVIGAAERAAAVSANSPWFLYCNPDAQLRAAAERSRRVLDDPRLRKLNLHVGPMALAGSTRMQASTVLMAAVGLALEHHAHPAKIAPFLVSFLDFVRAAGFAALAPLTAAEAAVYQKNEYTLYRTVTTGLTTLTDTTERAPTFSLAGFENAFAPDHPPSLTYLHRPGLCPSNAPAAWRALLLREPRTLEWPGLEKLTHRAWLLGYDFSDRVLARRFAKTAQLETRNSKPETHPSNFAHHIFLVEIENNTVHLAFDDLTLRLPTPPGGLLAAHLYLKLLLNAHSTALMARLGRCRGNLMTYVRPSNLKLIDRAARYARHLWRAETGTDIPYETTIRALFAIRPNLAPDQPAVLRILEQLRPNSR